MASAPSGMTVNSVWARSSDDARTYVSGGRTAINGTITQFIWLSISSTFKRPIIVGTPYAAISVDHAGEVFYVVAEDNTSDNIELVIDEGRSGFQNSPGDGIMWVLSRPAWWTRDNNIRLILADSGQLDTVIRFVQGLPDPISGLTTDTSTAEQITLDWNDSTDATLYRVARTTDGTTWTHETTTTSSSYTFTGLDDVTYCFRVRAENSKGNTDYEIIQAATSVIPDAPMIITATAGILSVTLSWDVVANAASYDLQYRIGSGDWGNQRTTDTNSYTYTELDDSNTYQFRVRSVGGGETSDWSTSQPTASPNAAPAPSAGFSYSVGGRTVFVKNSATLYGGETFFYDMGDGTTYTLQNVLHTYKKPGKYTVQQTITNGAGSDGADAVVTIFPEPLPENTPLLRSTEVRIYNHQGTLLRTIRNVNTLQFDIERNEVSTFSIALYNYDASWAFDTFDIPEDGLNYKAVVYRLHPIRQELVIANTYFLKSFVYDFDDNGQFFFALSGPSVDVLLTQKLLIAEEDARYRTEGVENITEAGVTSDIMADLVYYHLGDGAPTYRREPNIVIVKHEPIGQGGGRWNFEVLMDVLQDLAEADDVDFRMIYNPDTNEIEFHVGKIYRDRRKTNTDGNVPYVLAQRLGNLYRPTLSMNYAEEKNVLWIRQDPEDDTEPRLILRMQSETANIPYNKIEFENNNTRKDETETNIKLITDGRSTLKENAPQIELDARFENYFRHRYQQDWDFGDKITVEYAGKDFDFQITAVDISINGKEEEITPRLEAIIEDEEIDGRIT